ncbi:hypothetical protein BJF87_12565 [Gordonia sp. CNJ-863]|uniref:hypothetical protein n=1 Tax=Gordonia TaxID=2053 RepID=UPI0009622907|nr:hypothetical protein [Gordonia sp. CNJ-863]OLT52908.1 hypothetical protein BJF87_12565 [Gordonia sp. CNJ-863]
MDITKKRMRASVVACAVAAAGIGASVVVGGLAASPAQATTYTYTGFVECDAWRNTVLAQNSSLGATACARGFKGWQFDTYQAPTKQPQLTW